MMVFGSGTSDSKAMPTDLEKITVSDNTFDKQVEDVKFVKVTEDKKDFKLLLIKNNNWLKSEDD